MRTEEYDEGEVLTGAELYLYLLRQNEAQLLRAQEKLREYSTLKDTLHVLTERSRRRVLAPVAGGLAYYAAELNATNTILVLLGDGWFAERSAIQAAEIAGRRADFLRRETEVLQQEQSTLRAKQELFMSELPEAQEAVAELLAARETEVPAAQSPSQSSPASQPPQPPSQEGAPSSGSVTPASAPDRSGAPDAVRAAASPRFASSGSCPAPLPSSTPPTSRTPSTSSGLPLDYSSIDVALTTFDEQDELTEDELIALEAELGDRVNDDDFVERVMTERMIAKKERRIRAELERRSGGAAAIENRSKAAEGAPVSALPPTSASAAAPTATAAPRSHGTASAAVASAADNNGSSASRREAVTYRTPGDIGGTAARSLVVPSGPTDALPEAQAAASFSLNELVSEPAPTSSLSTAALTSARPLASAALNEADVSSAASSSASAAKPSRRKEQHVRFDADVKDTGNSFSVTAVVEARRPQVVNSPGELASCDQRISAEKAPGDTQSLFRSTYIIGDIVERNEGTANGGGSGAVAGAAVGRGVASVMPPPPLLPGQRQKPKPKSIFMRELEGDGA
ncbi:conserved hypothetical protein [Leishmania infantum JPCM5]|uniref:Prefoldin_subunit_-_putative n=2 Tax=Leishmania infantum TaxID=5671 RepID=A0A6L0XXW7_LEIIN|nr:conserved hypothetical protein [Leishmania infantum JPCM5]CAC9527011.1 Prefoldin_subunit_-_putative [Leishmania infantum]CAM71046.1 conserved hypothetical protein [Leishmania infantum JPCM5]SUZ44869.1 Prefoldin_subunit_-_putative [Leishmania infantum]|eukprot:XP_001467974.1 conserved hypothetical protein [Leishmania infantum JPCM5]